MRWAPWPSHLENGNADHDNVKRYQLAVLNPSINAACDNLQPGQSLCLGKTGEDCTATYVVKPNDTCDLVVSQSGTNSTMLWANNPQIDAGCTNIYVGEVSGHGLFPISAPRRAAHVRSSRTNE